VPNGMSTQRFANAMVYVQEELSDARLRCDELKHLMVRALEMIHASKKSDHFYAVAGDIIYATPQVLTKLEKALDAAAMAVNAIDTNDIRQVLRPEKVDELDRVLDEVRIRMPRRTGETQ
jgi:wyosine [tRNA(Phe)-imidazoG37] synthetase (radical SAM superfamily)